MTSEIWSGSPSRTNLRSCESLCLLVVTDWKIEGSHSIRVFKKGKTTQTLHGDRQITANSKMTNKSKNKLLPIYLRREKKESLLKSSNLRTNPLTNLHKIWKKIKVFNSSKKMTHSKEQHKNNPHHRSFLRSLRMKQACKSTLRYSSRIDCCLE